jgi:hypothetical protein
MNRYITSTNNRKDEETGKRKVDTVIVPSVSKQSTDTFIRVTSVERLDTLAYRFYDDVTAWPIIAAANGIGKGTLYVPSGTVLRIPSQTEFEEIIKQANSSR